MIVVWDPNIVNNFTNCRDETWADAPFKDTEHLEVDGRTAREVLSFWKNGHLSPEERDTALVKALMESFWQVSKFARSEWLYYIGSCEIELRILFHCPVYKLHEAFVTCLTFSLNSMIDIISQPVV